MNELIINTNIANAPVNDKPTIYNNFYLKSYNFVLIAERFYLHRDLF